MAARAASNPRDGHSRDGTRRFVLLRGGWFAPLLRTLHLFSGRWIGTTRGCGRLCARHHGTTRRRAGRDAVWYPGFGLAHDTTGDLLNNHNLKNS